MSNPWERLTENAPDSKPKHGLHADNKNELKQSPSEKILLISIMENLGVMLAYFDVDFNFVAVNSAYAKGSGHTVEELVGKNHFDLFPNDENQKIFENTKKTGKPVTFIDKPFTFADQPERGVTYWDWTLTPVKDETGQILGLTLSLFETTKRKRAENALHESQNDLNRAQAVAKIGSWRLDVQENKLVWSDETHRMFGIPKEKPLAYETFLEAVHPDDRANVEQKWKATRPGEPYNIEHRIVVNGEIKWIRENAELEIDKNGVLRGVFGTAQDITERKEMERALQESEEKYRNLVEQAPDSIFTFDMNGTVTSCNFVAIKSTGFSEKELIGKSFSEFVPLVESSKELIDLYNSLFAGGFPKPFEVSFITKNGGRFFGELHTRLLKKGEKITGFQAIIRDITERKKAQEELREREKRFRELSELLPEVVFETDIRGVLTFVNHEAYAKFEYSKEDFENGLTADQMISPKDRERAKKNLATLFTGQETGPNDYTAITKTGKTFPIIVNSTPIVRGNKIAGIRGIMVDITEHTKTEEALKNTLKNMETLNEKISVVGRLTRHDARNKLAVIMNNIYLAKRQLLGNNQTSENLDAIESAVDQIENIFDFARVYEKVGTEDPTYVDVKTSIDEACLLLSCSEGKILNECGGLKVLADSLLRQTFYNLLDNTHKYGETFSTIRVYYKKEKDDMQLIYEDNGVGVPENEKQKIFEEGYGKGTGYGLYLIKKICETYGWTIQETGIFGKGAQFTMTIPKQVNKKNCFIIL
ncbi:MAG: PAS domain S-box protein [Candidatus Bathyarchaeia archaeon]|jgi:PAS domain S-box-containing protein